MNNVVVTEDFALASDHNYCCRCPKCREWWVILGPEPDTHQFGPFTDELWKEYGQRHGYGNALDAKRFYASYAVYMGQPNPFPETFGDEELAPLIFKLQGSPADESYEVE